MKNMKKLLPLIFPLILVLMPLLFVIANAASGKNSPVQDNIVTRAPFLSGSQNDIEIVFFGFAGCSYICPTSLFTINEVLETIKEETPELRVGAFFVDVNVNGQIQRADEYSKFFSKNIKGVNVSKSELESLKKMFGLVVYQSERIETEIIHSDHFYILKKNADTWSIAFVLPNESGQKMIKEKIEKAI